MISKFPIPRLFLSAETTFSDSPDLTAEAARRNFRLGVINGVLYIIGDTLMDPTLVIAAFLSQLTSNDLLIGLIIPIRDGLWAIPQLWMTGYIQTLARKITLFRQVSIVRVICLAFLALEINFISDPPLLLVSFFATYIIAALGGGLSGLAWLEIVSKTIPSHRRGEFFALRFGISGVFNIGGSLFVRWLLSQQTPLAFPHNFGLLSFLYFLLASSGILLFNFVQEPADVNLLPQQSVRVLFKRALTILREDLIYRNFNILLGLMAVAGMATPFFAIYVQQSLGGDPSMVGVYLGLTIASNLLSNLFFGRISRYKGNRQVMAFSVLSGAGMSFLVLLLALLAEPLHISAQAASFWLIPVFLLSGIRTTGYSIASNCIMLDISPSRDRSLYVGFLNTLSGFVLVATGFSGVIKDLLGIKVLLGITLLAHILSLYLTFKIKIKRSTV
jgi:hypothetical protein